MMNIKNNVIISRAGFSLIEILIAVSIFAIVAMIASSMFSTFANNQKRTQSSQVLLNNTQYVLEIISREIKNNEIIYFGNNRCQNVLNAEGVEYLETNECLLFVRENGETAGFVYDHSAEKNELDYVQLECDRDGNIYSDCQTASGQTPVVLLSEDFNKVKITHLYFNLTPSTNPYFDDTGSNNQQPKVTINLLVEYFSPQLIERASHHLQTTVSSRVYKR